MTKPIDMIRALALPLAVLALAACSDAVAPTAAAPDAPRLASSGPYLIECPTDVSSSASAVVGPTGGVVEHNGHKMVIPLGAVSGLHEFRIGEPVSNYMEVSLTVDGQEHFQFEKPVSITISYERCTRSNIEKESLQIFYIDESTKEILQDLGGTDDKTAKTVTTSTDHLSAYAIGGS